VGGSHGTGDPLRRACDRAGAASGLHPTKNTSGESEATEARPVARPTTFVELLGPAGAATRCTVEVEAAPGKLRLELPALAPAELVPLLRAFLGH
jgi:hypothetical protein